LYQLITFLLKDTVEENALNGLHGRKDIEMKECLLARWRDETKHSV